MAGLALIVLLSQQPDFEPLYRQALEQREQALGKDAAKTRESARDLGLYLAGRGEYAKAETYREQALALADTAEAAAVLHNWAVTIEERDSAQAEQMYRKALAIRERLAPLTEEARRKVLGLNAQRFYRLA